MKIVYVTQRLPFGLGETFIIPEIEALLAAGHELLIVPRLSTDPILHDHVGTLVARTRPLPGILTLMAALARFFVRHPLRTARAFLRLHHTRPIRRAVSNTLATVQGCWVADVARSWGADHIHAHWAHLTATVAMAASEVSSIPWSFTAHRYDVVLNNLLTQKLQSACFGRFIAREMLEVARTLVDPEALSRAVVIHMGVTLPAAAPAPSATRPTPVVLCPARLEPIKGHLYLLDAAALMAARDIRFELWLAGDGSEGPALAQRIAELGLGDRVRLLGTVPQLDLLQLYRERQVDCVVLSSKYEGISVALMEAMAYGVPVIATSVGGLPELLGGGSGVLVPPESPGELAGALERMLGSPARRAELARAGRRRIAEEFDIVTIADQLARRFAGDGCTDRARPPSRPAAALRKTG